MRTKKKDMIVVALCITFILLILVLPYISLAGPLPDTGQTKCYNNTVEITCPSPGQPFYGQDAQYITYQQSYTKLNENGYALPHEAPSWVMVRDNVTGLIWEVKDSKDTIVDYGNPHDADNEYTWYDSNPATNGGNPGTPGDGTDTEDFINDLNSAQFGGFNDWRMPTIKELSFIRNMDTYIIAIDTGYFPNTRFSYYWSATTLASNPPAARDVFFGFGEVSGYLKSFDEDVRAVRSEQSGSFGDFHDNLDGTVTDIATGLMWEQKTVGNMSVTYNWEGALAYCEEDLSLGGYDDWRLPDVNELQSLVDYSTYSPAIDTIYFPNTVAAAYWSSTTEAYSTDEAWRILFNYGYTDSPSSKSDSEYVRCVRESAALKFDVDLDGNPEDPAKLLLCEGETGSIDIWLSDWVKPTNVNDILYYFTWDTSSLEVVNVDCNNLTASGGQWDIDSSTLMRGGMYSLRVIAFSGGVPGPKMKLHTVTLNCLTTPCTGWIKASMAADVLPDGGVQPVGTFDYYGVGETHSTSNTVCEDVEIDCSEQDCDVCTDICPPEVVPENNYYFWEPMDAGTEKCGGETISVFWTKTASYEVMQSITGDICDSPVFTQCLEDYVWFKIQPCYLKCTHGCQNDFCEHLDEEAVCDTYQRKVDGNTYCYDSCLGGTCSYDKECGFEVDETIYVKESNGTCAGSAVKNYKLTGDCTAVKDIPLPLNAGTYDICTASNYVIETFTVVTGGDCPASTCSISIPENFLVEHDISDSLTVTLSNVSLGGNYSLTLERWHDDGHEDPAPIPTSLQDPLDLTDVAAGSSSAPFEIDFYINANSPQPEEGKTHWDNVIIKAENGSVSCEAIFDYDIDACECLGDVHGPLEGDTDGDVDGSDAFVFKSHFGRNSTHLRPCTSEDPCYRDFECDGDVDGSDAYKFKEQFGRSDCPLCTFTCSYE